MVIINLEEGKNVEKTKQKTKKKVEYTENTKYERLKTKMPTLKKKVDVSKLNPPFKRLSDVFIKWIICTSPQKRKSVLLHYNHTE